MTEWIDVLNNMGLIGLLAALVWYFVSGGLFSRRQVEYMQQQVVLSQQITNAVTANTELLREVVVTQARLSEAYVRMADILASVVNNGGAAALMSDKRAGREAGTRVAGVADVRGR